MKNNMVNNYALITGASAGIGKQLAINCAQLGYNLFLVSLPETGLKKFSKEIAEKHSVDVQNLEIDLTEFDAPQKVFDFAKQQQITISILANNVGLGHNGKFENLSTKLIDDMILLNVRTSTMLMFLFLPQLKKLDKAYILNISSLSAFTPLPYKGVYAASKTYLLFLTRAIKHEIKESGVSITTVYPSGVKSERALHNIKTSSLVAKASALSTEEVARISLKNMFKENSFVIPGVVTKIYYLIGSILPHGFVLRVTGLVFKKRA